MGSVDGETKEQYTHILYMCPHNPISKLYEIYISIGGLLHRIISLRRLLMKWSITFILAAISVVCISLSDAQLDCNHPLRLLLPELFKHCNQCFYGSWSNWYRIGPSVSYRRCDKSGYAYRVERTRKDNYGNSNCIDEVQQEYQCE